MADLLKGLERTARTILRRMARVFAEARAIRRRIEEGVDATLSSLEARRNSFETARRRTTVAVSRPFPGPPADRERPRYPPSEPPSQPLPEGHLVARVAGEEAAFEAPIPMVEEKLPPPPSPESGPPSLPAAYHDDAFVALARDPYTLWTYWDFAPETVWRAMEGLTHPRTKLRIYQGEHRVRDLDFALESGSYYVTDLSPGERYEVEIVFVGDEGERRVGRSNPVVLPNFGPSPWVDDRFATLPWEARLGGARLFEGAPWEDFGEESEALGAWAQRGGASDSWIRPRRPEAGSQDLFRRERAHEEGR